MWPYICKPIMVIVEPLGEASNLDAALTRRLYAYVYIYYYIYYIFVAFTF